MLSASKDYNVIDSAVVSIGLIMPLSQKTKEDWLTKKDWLAKKDIELTSFTTQKI